jgi:metal-dependent hydrolase (beta-lactamase superfamily II)
LRIADGPPIAGSIYKDVAEHIETRPGEIDLLVVTHAHWDHVAGFHPSRGAASVFQGMQMGQVWLPWTENPDDNQATGHKKTVDKAHKALRAALSRASNPASVQHISKCSTF